MNKPSEKIDTDILIRKLSETKGLDKVKVLADLSEIFRESNPRKSIEFCKEGLELLAINENTELESKILNIICWCSQCIGKYEASLKYGFRKLNITNKTNDENGRSRAFNGIGIAYWRMGKFDQALDYFLRALNIIEKLGRKQEIAVMQNNIGLIFEDMGEYRKALEYFEKLIKTSEELDLETNLATSLNNAGTTYQALKEYEKALDYFLRSMDINKKQGNKWEICHNLTNIGKVYKEMGDFDKSLEYFFKSLKIEEEINDRQASIETLINIGLIYASTNKFVEALEYTQKGLDIAEELGVSDIMIMDCYETFSTIYEKKGNFSEALKYHKKFKDVNDKIFTEESSKKYNELKVSYETEKKERENEIYRLKNIELVKANEKLTKALMEVKTLSGLLPICASCKKIRDDSGYWKQIEVYISNHSDAQFSHGICPECMRKLYPEYKKSHE